MIHITASVDRGAGRYCIYAYRAQDVKPWKIFNLPIPSQEVLDELRIGARVRCVVDPELRIDLPKELFQFVDKELWK